MYRLLAIPLILFGFVSCREPVDASKFENVYRAAKEIQTAITVGVNQIRMSELLQEMRTEISIGTDRATTVAEERIVRAYEEVLVTYEDSLSVWRALSSYATASQADRLRAAMANEKYDLQSAGDSVQYIWSVASEKLAEAEALYLAASR